MGHVLITELLETKYIFVTVVDRQDVTTWYVSGKVSARPATNFIQNMWLKNWWRYQQLDYKDGIMKAGAADVALTIQVPKALDATVNPYSTSLSSKAFFKTRCDDDTIRL